MKKIISILMLLAFASTSVFASTSRILDGQEITNGAAVLTLPTSTDTLTGRATTDTLTNKTISGSANTISNVSLTAGVTGTLPLTNGGTGATTQSGAANAVLPSQTSQSGNFLTTNGTNASWAAVPSTAPALSGSTGSPTLITAVGGITFSGSNYSNIYFIAGSSAPITVTASPQISVGSAVGQELVLVGESATNTVTLADGTGLSLNGSWVGGLQSVLNLVWDGTVWVEMSRR